MVGGGSDRGAAEQAGEFVIGEVGAHAIGIDDDQRLPVGVVVGDLGGVIQGIADAREVALGVVFVLGEVAHIGAGAVDRQRLTEAVVAVGMVIVSTGVSLCVPARARYRVCRAG